jgi:hypothetical protein
VVVQGEQARAQRDVPLARRFRRRELDCVPDEVRDYLAETQRVADQLVRDVRIDVVREVKVVLGRADDKRLEDAKDGLAEGVCHGFHGHPTGFDYSFTDRDEL